jgi:ribosomal protein S18 acetylase RimI-like enzyme
VLIRPAVPADAEGVAGVHVASWQGAYRGAFPDEVLDGADLAANRLRLWQRLLGQPGPRDVNLVAEDPGGRPLGLLHGRPSRDDDAGPDTGEVVAIYASPDAWGTGVGRELMTAGLDRLRAAGFADVTLWVLDSNDRARRFYERAGFGPDGAEKDDVMAGTAIREVRYRRAL